MQAPACRLRVRAISTLSLTLAFAVAVPQFAAARDAAIDADGVTISQQLVPSGIVLVISEGIFALEESWSEAPALARLAATGVRFSDVVSSSPCAAESLQALETSRWTRERPASTENTRLIELFAAAGWSVDQVTGSDPVAAGASLGSRLDAGGGAPFLMIVKVPPSDSGRVQLGDVFAYLVGNADRAAVIDGGRKLIRRHTPEGVTHALYDHVSDRDDEHDITARHPDLTAWMIRRLDRWLAAPGTGRNPVS